MTEQQKTKRGRWKAGESGNPKGRTPGTGQVAKLRDSIAVHLPAIIIRPELVLFYRVEQEGEPTPEQAAQIAQAKKQGRPVKVIRIMRTEDSFPGFSKLPERVQGA